MIRIVAVSDTHSRHQSVEVPDGDLLIHAGDATMQGSAEEITEFNRWLGTLPHRRKVFCAGNHDWLFERTPNLARRLLTNARYLEDELIEVMGLRLYASPWQPRYFDWAFNLDRGAEIRRKWGLIPEGLDLLVTHGPPAGILDANGDGWHVGCEDLLARVKRVRPRVHVFGHIHEGYGRTAQHGVEFVNASICDGHYRASQQPVVIEIGPGRG